MNMDTAAADREIAQALSVRDAAGLRSGFVRASGVLDGYSFKLEPADKRGFFYVQDTWTKVLVQPRSRFYHILRVRDRSGRELKLHELLCRSDNPLADAFARVVKSRCGSAAATEAIAADLREIASLAAELDRQTAGRTVARVCGRLLALPFFMAYFTVSQFKAVIGMEGAVYKPRLIYPFHLPRVRRLCALIDRFRFTHRCILEEKSGQEHTAWISSGFDIETDPVRTYWGGVKTRLYFFLGDGVADAAGVGRALVWLRPPYDKNIGPENRAVYEAARTYPERLFGLGWTNPRLGRKAALRAIAETFDEYGLLGIKFNGAQDDYVIDDDSVMPFIEKAVSYGKPVAFHIGADGLMPGVMKMFLDPFHQKAPGDRTETIAAADYDHRTTTKWQRYFARDGLARTRSRGGDLSVITTLYGPPAFMTRQKIVRGRDLDPAFRLDCAKYIAAYAKYLRDEEGIPAKYVSVHNEGECWERWPEDEQWKELGEFAVKDGAVRCEMPPRSVTSFFGV